MKGMTLEAVTQAVGGVYTGPESRKNTELTAITIDSRQVEKGGLFVAIKGARVDGNTFIPGAYKDGACCCMSTEPPVDETKPYIRVESCEQALKDMAEFYRENLTIPVVGITGSVGKTTTKEMIAAVLSQKYDTLKTLGNFNNEIGLPLTIFRIREHHEAAVLEMGISDFGEMHRLAAMARPDIGVITNIGLCHLENLGTRDGILQAKTEMFDHLQVDGTVILNGDYDKLSTKKEVNGKPVIFYGVGADSAFDIKKDIYATDIENHGLEGMCAKIHTPQGDFDAKIPIPGEHNVYNALAAAAVTLWVGVPADKLQHALEHLKINGRMEIVYTSEKCCVIVDYAHNAVSMESLLATLREYHPKRLVVVFGCGGNRSKDRRYSMGEIGGRMADLSIITADNSRFEKVEDIIADIRGSIEKTGGKFIEIPDRKEAITYSITHAEPGDMIAIIGKGHEDYQEINGVRYPFLDRAVVEEVVKNL